MGCRRLCQHGYHARYRSSVSSTREPGWLAAVVVGECLFVVAVVAAAAAVVVGLDPGIKIGVAKPVGSMGPLRAQRGT